LRSPKWVTIQTTAQALDMTVDQVYRMIREDKFPFKFVRLGRLLRVSAADLGLIEPYKSEEQPQGEVYQTAA
jgi:excisionase family DNA binding protein